ncbi:MAG TPA: hypothetical protein VGI82_08790 [Chitinophagaceae bacterium]|jgi:hypothetical protein
MKKNAIILLMTLASFSLHAKTTGGGKVDPLIEAEFKKQFGTSLNVSWSIVEDVSIATYTERGQEKQVYYFEDGSVFGYGKIIDKESLPDQVEKIITAKFRTGIVQTVYEFKAKDAPTRYFVRVVTSHNVMILSADEFGNLSIDKKERIGL